MERKPNFQKAEMLARELRLMQPTNDFAIAPEDLVFDRDIIIDTFENYAAATGCSVSSLTLNGRLSDGYTIINGFNYIVLYYERHKGSRRLLWTLMHEIGHIYMGHTNDTEIEEVEAHWFASEFLMPIPLILQLLNRLETVNLEMLCSTFYVSPNAGLKRISSLKRMYKWSDYLNNDFVEKYNDAIDAYVNQIKIRISS